MGRFSVLCVIAIALILVGQAVLADSDSGSDSKETRNPRKWSVGISRSKNGQSQSRFNNMKKFNLPLRSKFNRKTGNKNRRNYVSKESRERVPIIINRKTGNKNRRNHVSKESKERVPIINKWSGRARTHNVIRWSSPALGKLCQLNWRNILDSYKRIALFSSTFHALSHWYATYCAGIAVSTETHGQQSNSPIEMTTTESVVTSTEPPVTSAEPLVTSTLASETTTKAPTQNLRCISRRIPDYECSPFAHNSSSCSNNAFCAYGFSACDDDSDCIQGSSTAWKCCPNECGGNMCHMATSVISETTTMAPTSTTVSIPTQELRCIPREIPEYQCSPFAQNTSQCSDHTFCQHGFWTCEDDSDCIQGESTPWKCCPNKCDRAMCHIATSVITKL